MFQSLPRKEDPPRLLPPILSNESSIDCNYITLIWIFRPFTWRKDTPDPILTTMKPRFKLTLVGAVKSLLRSMPTSPENGLSIKILLCLFTSKSCVCKYKACIITFDYRPQSIYETLKHIKTLENIKSCLSNSSNRHSLRPRLQIICSYLCVPPPVPYTICPRPIILFSTAI